MIEPDGTIKKEIVKKEHKNSREFLKKRRMAYENEYVQAKKKAEEEDEDDDEENDLFSGDSSEDEKEIEEETIKNTIINKFSGKVDEKKAKALMKKTKQQKEKSKMS